MTDKLIFDLYSALLSTDCEDTDLLIDARNYLGGKLAPEPLEEEVVLPDLRDVLDKLDKHQYRITKALGANNITTTEELIAMSSYQLLWMKNFGQECLRYLRQALGEYDLKFVEF